MWAKHPDEIINTILEVKQRREEIRITSPKGVYLMGDFVIVSRSNFKIFSHATFPSQKSPSKATLISLKTCMSYTK